MTIAQKRRFIERKMFSHQRPGDAWWLLVPICGVVFMAALSQERDHAIRYRQLAHRKKALKKRKADIKITDTHDPYLSEF